MKVTRIFLLVLVLIVITGANSPRIVFEDFIKAIQTGDADKSWELMSDATHKTVDGIYQVLKDVVSMSPESARVFEGVTDGKSFWKKSILEAGNDGLDMKKEFANTKVINEEISGKQASLLVEISKKTEKINMVLEKGNWKLDLPDVLNTRHYEGSDCTDPSESKIIEK